MALQSLTNEQLEEIKRLAELAFVPREIAVMVELDNIDHFVYQCEVSGTPEYRAFHGGRLQRQHDLREKIFKLADSGSSPAQTMAMNILQESELKTIDR